MALGGNEVIYVEGVQANGQPAATFTQTTTGGVAGSLTEISTATQTYTSNATASAITGLSLALVSGGTYSIHGQLQGAAVAVAGVAATLNGTAGLSLTSANLTGWHYNGTTLNAVSNVTALDSDFANSTAAYTNVIFDGTLVVNAGGTLRIAAAQHASSTASTTVVAGSYVSALRIS